MDYGEGSSLTGRLSNSNNFKIYVAIFVLWNILLFSLAVSGVALARKNSNNDSDSSSTTTDPCIKTTVPLYSENKYYSTGMAVSLVSEDGGSVRVGGGTTIYKRQKISDAIASLTDFVIIDIDSTHVFLAFTTPNGTLAYSVGVISSDQVIWNEAFSSKVQAGHLASGAKLTSNLLVLGTDAGVIPITIQLPTVTIYEPATNQGASNNTQLCALDTNAIAVSFPLPPAGMVTTAAIVTYTPGTAPVVTWAENTEQYSVSILSAHTVACFEPEHYLLSYVDNTSIVSQGIFFAPSSNQITFTASSILPGVTAAQYIRSATLKDSLAVAGILYIDTTQNALLTTTVGLTADLIQYGTSLVINSGGVLGDVSQTKIAAIAPFGAENGFVVSYSDWANQDRVTILVGQIAESNTMEAASPAYVISNPNTDQYNHQYWSDIVKLSETTFVNAFALMNGTSADGIGSATGLVLTAPIGVIMEVQEDEAVVGVSGQCAVLGNIMNVGNYYYTDSLGILYARNPSDTPLYEYLDYGNLILSKNTLVGVGINSKDVLIKTTVY